MRSMDLHSVDYYSKSKETYDHVNHTVVNVCSYGNDRSILAFCVSCWLVGKLFHWDDLQGRLNRDLDVSSTLTEPLPSRRRDSRYSEPRLRRCRGRDIKKRFLQRGIGDTILGCQCRPQE